MADKAGLSDKERALIEAARREAGAASPAARPAAPVAATAAPATTNAAPDAAKAPLPGRTQGQAPRLQAPEQPVPELPAGHAARIAALMAAERAEIERRRRRARRWGIHFPMTLFAVALVWMTLRQFG